jgi:hypothetical protein
MDTLPPYIRELAQRLIAIEETQDPSPEQHTGGAVRVCENLRFLLSRLAGAAGFRSLLSRALVLARAETPSLRLVRIGADGSLERIDEVSPDGDPGAADDGGVALVAWLLALLVTFIGPSLTFHLVRDGWPDASWDGIDLRIGETP